MRSTKFNALIANRIFLGAANILKQYSTVKNAIHILSVNTNAKRVKLIIERPIPMQRVIENIKFFEFSKVRSRNSGAHSK
jgi:hypothetical protein